MATPPELPSGWDPHRDSLEDLVRNLFHDESHDATGERSTQRPESSRPSPPVAAAPVPSADAEPAPRPAPEPPVGEAERERTRPRPSRPAVPVLAAAILLIVAAGGWQITATNRPATEFAAGAVVANPAVAPTTAPVSGPVSPPPSPTAVAALTSAAITPEPIGIPFGARSDVGEGWRLAATRPYLCDVLMAIPVLQKDGTRIIRVTLTLTNRTGAAQRARVWDLAATADHAATELVLWPAERFRGVPDVTLAPGRSVRFLVAVRVPDRRTQVEITAHRADAPRAVLSGSL